MFGCLNMENRHASLLSRTEKSKSVIFHSVNSNASVLIFHLWSHWCFAQLSLQVNGIYISLPAFQINDLVEVHEEQGFVVINAFNKLMVNFDGDSILVVRLSQSFNGSVSGMCGNFNGNPEDDKELPCGGLAPNDTVFGNSWKSDISTRG